MNRNFTCLIFTVLCFSGTVYAQAPTVVAPTTMPYGKIDKADLILKECEFEKDANAEILFDKGEVYFDSQYNVMIDRHKRIKIFKDKAKDEANIRIEYSGGNRSEAITNVQAETINDNNGTIEITKVDKKLIYTQRIDNRKWRLFFSFRM